MQPTALLDALITRRVIRTGFPVRITLLSGAYFYPSAVLLSLVFLFPLFYRASMGLKFRIAVALLYSGVAVATNTPRAVDTKHDVTYNGIERNGIEVFLNIPYGQDTGGANRFKPPKPYVNAAGSTIEAKSYGPSCPQALGGWTPPISLGNITDISEDCLNLNIARPKGACAGDQLPVMVYIHGGSFWAGDNHEPTILPDGMILESEKNGLPIIHVALNYRLGCKQSGHPLGLRYLGTKEELLTGLHSLWVCTVQRSRVRGLRECWAARPAARD